MLQPLVFLHCTFMFTCNLPLSIARGSLSLNSSRITGHFLRCRSGIFYIFDLLDLDSIAALLSFDPKVIISVRVGFVDGMSSCSNARTWTECLCTDWLRKSVFALHGCRCVRTVRRTFSNVTDVSIASQSMRQGWCVLQATTSSFETIVSAVRLGSVRCSWTIFCVHRRRFSRI